MCPWWYHPSKKEYYSFCDLYAIHWAVLLSQSGFEYSRIMMHAICMLSHFHASRVPLVRRDSTLCESAELWGWAVKLHDCLILPGFTGLVEEKFGLKTASEEKSIDYHFKNLCVKEQLWKAIQRSIILIRIIFDYKYKCSWIQREWLAKLRCT